MKLLCQFPQTQRKNVTMLQVRLQHAYPTSRSLAQYGRGDYTLVMFYHYTNMPNGVGCGVNYADYQSGDGPQYPFATARDFYVFPSTIALLCVLLEE